MFNGILKPVGLPPDARGLMKFSRKEAAQVKMLMETAIRNKTWETSQNIKFVLDDSVFWAYWIYKTAFPIVKAMEGSGIEQSLAPFRKTRFDLMPPDFVAETELTLSASGDLMCTRGLEHSKDRLYQNVEELIFGADFAYANLESTLTAGKIVPTSISSEELPKINITPEQYEALLRHGKHKFDIVQLANNHILDCGSQGVETTLARLKADGIAQTGINATENPATHITITEVGGIHIGWIAHTFCLNLNPPPADKPWLVNSTPFHMEDNPDLSNILTQIRACREKGCDLVFVCLHWGLEFEFFPHPEQLKWARIFAESGADAIIGHHPHVVQPAEIYRPEKYPGKSVPVLYSLGNLTPIMSGPATVLSLVARLRIAKGRIGTRTTTVIAELRLVPVSILAQIEADREILRLFPLDSLMNARLSAAMRQYVSQSAYYADIVLGKSWRHTL